MNGFKRIFSLSSPAESITDQLNKSHVPVSNDPCRTCANPCEFGHPDYPGRFDVDLTSEMLGSLKPYQRQIVISTGKADWAREVTEEEGSLAQYVLHTSKHHGQPPLVANTPNSKPKRQRVVNAPGVFNSSDSSRLSILNGSHHTISCEDSKESVLVFPDFKVVKDVDRSQQGADQLWHSALDPALNRAGRHGSGGGARSWPLPYACVILLCSHKRRDNRCHIAAPKLQSVLTDCLESEGYEVHTQLDGTEGPPLEEIEGTDEEREKEFLRRLQGIADSDAPKKVLILKNSHIGGHKYTGNVVIYTPEGAGVWYGRVTPHEVPAVVKTTICEGRVLPALLRGGINLTRPEGRSLLSW
ncbi:Sucrase/ferredoxin-like-domain-containing protein [Hysterangium stoloniferum]|nr:Sucrase/ferredoxin-like-domain-containing protein [Hysterangium stoloniferum]